MKKQLSIVITVVTMLLLLPFTRTTAFAATENWFWPVDGVYTMSRGYNSSIDHWGIDITGAGVRNKAVLAAKSGTIIESSNSCPHNDNTSTWMCTCNGSMGNYAVIDHGDGTWTRYMHMIQGTVLAQNTIVTRGQKIGEVGSSGESTGAHLHFEVYTNYPSRVRMDPAPVDWDNRHGWYNYIDISNPTIRYDYTLSYTSMCDEDYACHAIIEIESLHEDGTWVRAFPCNENTAREEGFDIVESDYRLRKLKVGETYEATRIYKNTEGNYWYEVKWTEGGIEKTGYIYSARTKMIKLLWNDADFINKSVPVKITQGNSFGLFGTISSKYTNLSRVETLVLDVYGNEHLCAAADASGSYTLDYSPVDTAMVFGSLPVGTYKYEVKATLQNYSADENQLSEVAQKEVLLTPNAYFSVVDPQPIKYPVYFDGGTLNPEYGYAKSVYGGNEVGSLPTAELAGYEFVGWYTDPEFGVKVSERHVITGSTHFYARYQPKEYKIYLDGYYNSVNMCYGDSFAGLPTPSKDGYVFDGWYTELEGGIRVTADTYLRYTTGAYARMTLLAEPSDLMPDEGSLSMILYAHWSIATGSGVCGDNLCWEIDENGVLTIAGTGKMYDYPQATDVPWNINRAAITEIVLPSGMTSICDNAFSNITKVRTVDIPYTVESLGDSAFEGCSQLVSANVYSKDIESNLDTVFAGCNDAFTLYSPEDAMWINSSYREGTVDCSHEYEMDFVAPTCVDDGYERYICAMCGDEYHENYVDATGEHFYEYSAEGNRLVEVCINGCDHEEYATVSTEKEWYFFIGDEIEPADVQYTDAWAGEELTVVYENNAAAGIATASISVADVTAFTNFTLVEPQVLVVGYCGDNLVWSIREDGVLFIECDGEMPDENPWKDWLDESGVKIRVREVVISSDATSIGAGAFSGMYDMESISLPDTIETIGDSAFSRCSNLKEIDLPEGVLHIGAKAFYNCYNLQEIELPESLVSIGGNAFDGCDEITSIALGANVSNISTDYWSGNALNNYYLEEIIVDSANPYYTSEDGVLYNADQTVLIKYPTAKRGSVFEVPFSVKSIAADAFYKSRWLEEVHIPYSVTSISYSAFGDTNIESMWFYGDATSISSRSIFSTYATDLVIYYVESNTTWPTEELDAFPQRAFVCAHESIADRVIEETCIEPGYYGSACQYCGKMLEVYDETPASGSHELMYSAQYSTITESCSNCDHTATARLSIDLEYYAYTGSPITPATVKYSENWAGGELFITYAQNIDVGQATAEIEIGDALVQDVFYIEAEENFDHGICGDNLTWILTPDNVLTIRGTGPMYDMDPDNPTWYITDSECYPETVIIEDGVTSIGAYAFFQHGISTISLPDSITSIGEYAFYNCAWLEAIDLPENLVEVGEMAFQCCSALTTVEFPSKWNTIPEAIFKDCGNLTSVKLPDNLYEIGSHAFMWTGLTSIEFPDSLAKIGVAAFYSTKLESVTLPANVEVELGAFESCVTEVYVCTDLPNGSSEEVFVDLEYLDDNKQVTVYCADPEADWFKQDWELIEVELWQPEDHVNAERSVEPTCGKGYTFHYCEYCGNGYKTDFIDSVADHDLSYYAVGDTIVETCDNGCGHKETARVSVTEYYHTCIREELSPAEIVYSEDWQGGTVTIEYRNNVWAGIADALAIYQTARAETQFLITEAPVLGYGSCGENLVWRLEESGILTISGTGEMYDYGFVGPMDDSGYPEWIDPEWVEQCFEMLITMVVIEDGVTSVGDYAFAYCDYVRDITLGADIENIGAFAFYETYMKSVPYLPKLAIIEEGAFAGCYNLQTVSVGKELQFIGENAFGGCGKLAVFAYDGSAEEWGDVVIADGADVDSVGNNILTEDVMRYHSLSGIQAKAIGWIYDRQEKKLTLDNPMFGTGYAETIDDSFFSAREWDPIRAEVEHVYIGADVYALKTTSSLSIGNWFFEFDSLESFEVSPDNTNYMSIDGVLYSGRCDVLCLCPATKTEVVVPASVTTIQSPAFGTCYALQQIIFEGEAPKTDYSFDFASHLLFPKSADVRITYYSDTATTGWHEYPWKSYNSIGINRFTTPSMNYGGGKLIIEVDTTTWEMYDKPVVLICAIYDEAGKMLETSIAYVTYDKQQFEFSRNDTTTTGQLFLLTDWENATPLLDDLSFEIVSN